MIELRRLRLVNWHNFSDDLLDFKQITYFVGVNAVGKTTIMDAIRYCLTTSKNFNALGNRKSGRTLQGSVHGKQRGEDVYSRPGHTVSYIGTEFLDPKGNKTFVIVARVESESPEQEMRHIQQTWYITPPGCTLEMLPFVDQNTRQPTKREQFCLASEKMPAIDRQSEALDRICKVLGIGRADSLLGKKFNAVFQMGTSLDEIQDFRTFIYNYILPQPEINLDALQQDKIELERLQDVLNEAKQRAEKLYEITEMGRSAQARQEDVTVNEGFILYASDHEAAERKREISLQLQQYTEQIESLQERYHELENKEELAHQRYIEVCKITEASGESKMLELLRQQETEKKREYAAAERELKSQSKAEAQLRTLLRRAESYKIQVDAKLWPDSIREVSPQEQQALLDQLKAAVLAMEPIIEERYFSIAQQQQEQQKRKFELSTMIRALDEGRWIYPDQDRANVVKKEINTKLIALGMNPDAKILCELLFMNEPSWQDCVEACLGNRRFDILVEPKHYRTAKRAFEDMGGTVGRIALLDTPALTRDIERQVAMATNTLATKLSSENQLASYYLVNLLGDIVCCETSDTLEQFKNSATRDLLRHYPYRLERMQKPQLFIGLDARKQRLEAAKKELALLEEQLAAISKQYKSMGELRTEYQTTVHGTALSCTLELWGSKLQYEECWHEYKLAQARLQEFEQNPRLRAALQKEAIFRKEWEDTKRKREEAAGDIRVCNAGAATAREGQAQATQNAEATAVAWESFRKDNLFFVEEIEKKYDEASQKRTPKEIVKNQQGRHNQFINALNEFVNNTLIPLQRQFNERYICDLPTGLGGIAPFRRQYDSLVSIDMERFAASLQKAQERCKERFRKDILYHMKDDIANAKRQFKELNHIMARLSYGEEVYYFDVDGSADPRNNAFYNLIVDKNDKQMTVENIADNESPIQDAAYEDQVEELMTRIMADIDQKSKDRQAGKRTAEPELTKFADYRSYLDYDIKVTNHVTGQKASLSKVSRDSSGGENQAPFYIAICASLLQIYQKSENSIRLVLLDEAFSRMTSDRIRPMMQMFRQMHLQVLLITTVEKSSAIHPYCDVTYSVVKSGTRNGIAPFFLEEQ